MVALSRLGLGGTIPLLRVIYETGRKIKCRPSADQCIPKDIAYYCLLADTGESSNYLLNIANHTV